MRKLDTYQHFIQLFRGLPSDNSILLQLIQSFGEGNMENYPIILMTTVLYND